MKMRILLGLIVFLTACSGDITGKVFLDRNGNNEQDDGEPNLANVTFSVTLDDEDFDAESTQTDTDGHFTFAADGAGTYCVEVDGTDLSSVNEDGTEPIIVTLSKDLGLAAAQGLPVLAAETSCTGGTDDDGDGDADCLDSDCSSSSSCGDDSSETDCGDNIDNDSDGTVDCDDSDCSSDSECDASTETDCGDGVDNDDDGLEDCSDDDCDGDSECDSSSGDSSDTATVEDGQACDDSTGFGLELNVPIAQDYSSGVEALDDPSTFTVSRGDEITLEIIYPDSCDFDLIFLPTSITPVGVPSASYDETTGEFNFNTAIDAATVTTSDPLSVEQDALSTFELDVSIDQDGSLDSQSLTITPTVTCPDDSTVTLQTQTIEIDSADDFDVTQSISGDTALGESLTVTTTITNNTAVDYTSDQVTLDLAAPTLTSNQDYDSSCSDLGETASCSFDIGALDTVTLVTTFDMPDSIVDDTTFEMTATLTLEADGSSATFEGDTVSFSIAGEGSGS